MSERDELAKTILHHPWLPDHEGLYTGLCPECPGRKIHGGHNSPSHADHLADAILAAGYSKPRTISTPEELDSLFQGDANVVLLDEDGISLQNLAGGWQAATGSRRLMTSDLTFHCFGPTFTVLHERLVA